MISTYVFSVARARSNTAANCVYSIKFDPELPSSEPPPVFGAKYTFHLEGVVDCPEFLVHFPTLIELAEKHGLMLVAQSKFESFYQRVRP